MAASVDRSQIGRECEHEPSEALFKRDRLQAHRLRAAELFAVGVHQAGVARHCGVGWCGYGGGGLVYFLAYSLA